MPTPRVSIYQAGSDDGVYAGIARPPGFAPGVVIGGSYNAATRVWTPEKTAGGVVKQGSWDETPINEWFSVAGTRLDSLNAEILASGRGWIESTLAMHNVMNAWNGFAIDQAGCRVWLVCAGGHNDSANNGIYRFDAYRMSWSVTRMPSDRAPWTTRYITHDGNAGGSFTDCPESQDATPQAGLGEEAATATPRKYHTDQLFWTVEPTSRHVYSGAAYAPDLDRLILACRTVWEFDATTGAVLHNVRFPSAVDGAELRFHYCEATGIGLFTGMADGHYTGHAYNPTTRTFSSPGERPWSRQGVADCEHDDFAVMLVPPFSNRHDDIFYYKWNKEAQSMAASDRVQLGGGLAWSDFTATAAGTDGMGMVYVPTLNRYWVVYQMVAGMRWLELDPTTTPWTLRPLTFTNAPTVNSRPCRKLAWFPGLAAVGIATYADQGWQLRRPVA